MLNNNVLIVNVLLTKNQNNDFFSAPTLVSLASVRASICTKNPAVTISKRSHRAYKGLGLQQPLISR